jgi:Uma2 family endonuclease
MHCTSERVKDMTNAIMDDQPDVAAAEVASDVQNELMTVDDAERVVKAADFRGRNSELINGRLVEKAVPTSLHNLLSVAVGSFLFSNKAVQEFGFVMTEADVILPEDRHNWRRPDLACIGRAQGTFPLDKVLPFMPWLIIEIKSPGNTYSDQRLKAIYYLEKGARIVWLIFPEREIVEVYQADEQLYIIPYDETLTGGDVIPGLTLRMRDIMQMIRI